jgi:large subunit ribosomal protein L3
MSEQTQKSSPSAGRLGLLGRKVGMTRIFTAEGESVPVTVLDVSNNRVAQVRAADIDGYSAIQVAFGKRRPSRVIKPLAGHYAKAGVEAGEVLKEFRIDAARAGEFAPGSELSADLFSEGQKVDVTGVTIGKGFAGVIKRQDPGRVMPGKRMAGHLGDVQRTTQNLVIARVDKERQLLLVRGAVPGAAGGRVIVRPAVKA